MPKRISIDFDRVRKLLDGGRSVCAVAQALGVNEHTLRGRMAGEGIPLPTQRRSPVDLDRVKALMAEGRSLQRIADEMGTSRDGLRHRLRRAGIRVEDFSSPGERLRVGKAAAAAARRTKVALPPSAAQAPAAAEPVDADLAATGGRYNAIASYAAARDLSFTQAMQRWHLYRAQRRAEAAE